MSTATTTAPTIGGPLGVRVLAYHEFGKTRSTDVYQLTPVALRSHLKMIHCLALEKQMGVQITFDDAHVSQVEVAGPLMEEFMLTGIFFVPAAWVNVREHTCSWDQLRSLIKKGHLIGSHGLTHQLLTSLCYSELKNELARSRDILENALGVQVHSISMPGGRWNSLIATACFDAGYRTIYTSEPVAASVSVPYRHLDVRHITGRLAIRRNMSTATLERYVTGEPLVSAWLKSEYKVKTSLKRALGDKLYQTIWRRLLRTPLLPQKIELGS